MADDESDELIWRSESEEHTENGTETREANQHDYQTAEIKAEQVADGFKNIVLKYNFKLFIDNYSLKFEID